ncbi:MAG: AAA family ATPase [Bacteroidia bacterium]|nr:AAA family ATPase [Bacteroidia bacterium]
MAYKWKVAFLYSNLQVVNIFKPEALQHAAQNLGMENPRRRAISALHRYILGQRRGGEFFEFCERLWVGYADGVNPETSQEVPIETPFGKRESSEPLNQILFGPPGTGKTYNTISKAISIVDPEFYYENDPHTEEGRSALKARFDQLLFDDMKNFNGRIAFCTFHQAFAYEDFIEGIKPLDPEDNDTYLKYRTQPGIFKQLAQIASSHQKLNEEKIKGAIHIPDSEMVKAQFFKISLGNSTLEEDTDIYRYCMDNGYISMGWGEDIDFTGKSEKEIKKLVKDNNLGSSALTFINQFAVYLKVGHYVVVSNGNLTARAIGKVTGEYEFIEDSEIGFHHFRKVNWLVKDEDIPVEKLYERAFMQKTIYKLKSEQIKKDFFTTSLPSGTQVSPKEKPRFVLIIDEINRGNIAQIFGELITLIEPDKREGKKEALQVILPYSKDVFSVPENLYLIGTMNTADRSVEALDTALRRRFHFEEMPPKPELLASPARKVWQLWWDHKKMGWDESPYKENEEDLFQEIGAPENWTNEQKQEIWDKMRDENAPSVKQIALLESVEFTGKTNQFSKGPDLQWLLETINRRILKLLDKDHLIGHSYFLGIKSLEGLKMVFHNKIIPLLQEYFFGDFAKIGLVIGPGFFKDPKAHEEESSEDLFAEFHHDALPNLLSRPVLELVNVMEMEDDDFQKALNQLLRV